jgi:hypothetical protein
MLIIEFLFAVLLTELLTELVIKSVLFKPLRKKLPNFFIPFHEWVKELLGCGYCFSVWVAFGVAFLLQVAYDLTGWYPVDLALTALVIHRVSNYLHNFNDCWLDKYYNLTRVNSEKAEDV